MNIFCKVLELWPGHKSGTYGRGHSLGVMARTQLTIWNLVEEIIKKPKMQELFSLFMTHRLRVMYALYKFHEYIPYSLGVMARTQFTIWN